jgi:hypothetical protein
MAKAAAANVHPFGELTLLPPNYWLISPMGPDPDAQPKFRLSSRAELK